MNTQITTSNEMLSKAQGVFDLLDVNETTRSNYKKDVKVFIGFIQENPLNINSFLEFKRHLRDRNDITPGTKNKYLTTARTLLKELSKNGALPTDITQNVKGFEQGRGHKKSGISEAEMRILCANMQNVNNTRLKAILALLIYQGLRQVEVVRLNTEDLDLINLKAKITGKGRDSQELINLHPETVMALSIYIEEYKISGPLFVSESNNSKGQRLTTKSIRREVKKILTSLSISKSTHSFRHHFVTQILKKTKGNLLLAKSLSRHKSFEMVEVYNDELILEQNLPVYYGVFDGIKISNNESMAA